MIINFYHIVMNLHVSVVMIFYPYKNVAVRMSFKTP